MLHLARDPNLSQAGAERRRVRRCPVCGKAEVHAFRPFCSKRCADVDLARWLGGRYAIPGEPVEGERSREEAARADEKMNEDETRRHN